MKTRGLIWLIIGLALAGRVAASWAEREAPDWLNAAMKRPYAVDPSDASALVLLDQTVVDLGANGTATETHRVAIRIRGTPGTGFAAASVPYYRGQDKVKTTNSWLVRKGEIVKNQNGSEWLDLSSDLTGTLYSDQRYKLMSRESDAAIDDVFAAETVVTGPQLFSAFEYEWKRTLPVVEESYQITVPAGFAIKQVIHGTKSLKVTTSPDGRTMTWTLLDQPLVRSEPDSPDYDPRSPMIWLRVEPPEGAAGFKPAVFHSWSEIAAWIKQRNAGQCDSSKEIADRVQSLTAGCTDQMAKIRALGRFVQGFRWVGCFEKLAEGFGYQPQKATVVFRAGYGDCKDKANLLCSMLHEAGITSYMVHALSQVDREVDPQFPSPDQFNHAILAIKVDETVQSPAIVEHTPLGRLLFFDPTDEFTMPGDLPYYLQGTRVQLQDEAADTLVELPRIAPGKGHVYVRHAVLHLSAAGTFAGTASVLGQGQAGAWLRRGLFEVTDAEQLRKYASNRLGDAIRAATVDQIVRKDDAVTGICGIEFELSKPGYLQFLPGGLAVAKLDIFNRGTLPSFPAPDRHLPIKLDANAFDDEIRLVLPTGFKPEEIPAPVSISSEYGSYARSFKVEGDTITLTRHVTLNARIIPAADYPKIKKFLSDLAKADRASVLLRTGGT